MYSLAIYHNGADLIEQHAYQNAAYHALYQNYILKNSFDFGMMSGRKHSKKSIQSIIKPHLEIREKSRAQQRK